MAAHQRRVDRDEGLADRAGEGEVGLEVAAVVIVVEDAADAARLVAVLQEEILVAPFLEAGIVGGVGGVAGRLERAVEVTCVGLDREDRRQVGAAAEPEIGRASWGGRVFL